MRRFQTRARGTVSGGVASPQRGCGLWVVGCGRQQPARLQRCRVERASAAHNPKPTTHNPARPKRARGFTLIEVLVAFIVFVAIFGAVLEALGMALRNTRRSAEVSEAALWAQSKLDALGTVDELEEGSETGEFNRNYRWQLDVTKQDVPREDGMSADSFPVELYRVELVVSWGDRNQRREQHFVTMRSKLKEGQF